MVKDATGLSLLSLVAVAVASPNAVEAHPAHAKPVNYPFVVGFERFHGGLDNDDYLAEGGFILLNELNCVACHEPPPQLADQLSGAAGTNLEGVAGRLDQLDLEIMIRNPRFAKRDTAMPSLFAGPDRDLDEVEALKHYLGTLTRELPDYPVGDVDEGRRFYHRVGCVACHAPEVGYRPEGIPENAGIEMTGLPSVPMNLADLYSLDSLVHFLLNPREHRPSGRMPDFKLSETEAVDLAAYLKAGPDLVLPKNLTEALNESRIFEFDSELAETGREVFRTKNCSACHTAPGENEERTRFLSKPLAELDAEARTDCLSERPPGGKVPFYGLDEVQKRAIAAALERLDGRKELDLAGEIDWRMKKLNCYACHERGGVGGPEIPRETYFGFESKRAVGLGRWGNLPPALDHVGAKLTGDWLDRILLGTHGGGEVRDYMTARMPLFLESDAGWFARHFPKADSLDNRPANGGGVPLENRGKGRELFSAEGKNCVQCHGAGDVEASELPGIDLATTPERLRKDYFRQLLRDPQSLKPGTPMPDQFDATPEDAGDISALWRYLKSVAED
ncbi:MAG: hypothetical protein WD342_08520 [Verrucomicrobiales bacterium]